MTRDEEIAFDVSPLYGQIEIGDRDTTDVPQWLTGEEPVVSSRGMVCVATRPDTDGDVRVRIRSGGDPSGIGRKVFSGELDLPSGILAVGNSIAAQVEEVDLSPAQSVRIGVFIDSEAAPNIITVMICPCDAEPQGTNLAEM